MYKLSFFDMGVESLYNVTGTVFFTPKLRTTVCSRNTGTSHSEESCASGLTCLGSRRKISAKISWGSRTGTSYHLPITTGANVNTEIPKGPKPRFGTEAGPPRRENIGFDLRFPTRGRGIGLRSYKACLMPLHCASNLIEPQRKRGVGGYG